MICPRVLLVGFLCLALAGCGGGPENPPPPVQPTPDFNITVQPSNLVVALGASTQIQVTKTAVNGFTGAVSVDANTAPAGVTFSPALPQQVGPSGLTLSVATDSSVQNGTYKVTFAAAAGGLRHSADIDLTVGSRANLSVVAPAQAVHVAQSGNSSVPIAINSDDGVIDFDVLLQVSAPSGMTATLSSSTVAPNTSVSVTVAAGASAPIGPAVVDIQATRSVDGVQSWASIPVYVDPDPASIVSGTITEFPLPTAGAGPSAIAAGPDLAMWFGEESASQLGRIAIDGTISEFPLPTSNAGLGGVATGVDGNIYFTEFKTSKVGRYSPALAQFTEWDTPLPAAGPGGIVSAPDGTLWVLTASVGNVFRLTTQGVFLQSIPLSAGCFPHGPTIGSDGNLWFACVQTDQIASVTPQGTVTYFALPSSNSRPTILTNAADGNIYFTEQAGRIGELNLSTLVLSEWTVPTPNSIPYGIAAVGTSVCFTERSAGELGCMPLGGGTIVEYPVPCLAATPSKIALGPDDRLWFTEQTGNNIGQLK